MQEPWIIFYAKLKGNIMEQSFNTVEQYKTQARLLHKSMKDMGLTATYMQAMQLVAKSYNCNSWEVLEKKALKQELAFKVDSSSEVTLNLEKNDSVWVKVKNISVKVQGTDEGVVVDCYPVDSEDDEAYASTYMFYDEATEEEYIMDHAKEIKESFINNDPNSYNNQQYAIDLLTSECSDVFKSRKQAEDYILEKPTNKFKK